MKIVESGHRLLWLANGIVIGIIGHSYVEFYGNPRSPGVMSARFSKATVDAPWAREHDTMRCDAPDLLASTYTDSPKGRMARIDLCFIGKRDSATVKPEIPYAETLDRKVLFGPHDAVAVAAYVDREKRGFVLDRTVGDELDAKYWKVVIKSLLTALPTIAAMLAGWFLVTWGLGKALAIAAGRVRKAA